MDAVLDSLVDKWVEAWIARHRPPINFAMAVSASCAVAGGAAVAYLPTVSMGLGFGLGFGALLLLLPLTAAYVRLLRPWMPLVMWFCLSIASVVLLLVHYLVFFLILNDRIASATYLTWATEVPVALFLGWCFMRKRDAFHMDVSSSADEEWPCNL